MTTFRPNKKQYQALELLSNTYTTEIGYGGGASGGKSYLGCAWVTMMCISNANVGYVIGRKELTTLKKTTILTLFKVFKDLDIKEGAYNYNQQNNIITFTNGSQIFLIDMGYKPSDPLYTRFGGLELTGAFIDESNECEEDGIKILSTRLGRRGEIPPKLFETFNPSKNHIYKRYYFPYVKGDMPKHRAFIPALATDNPYTSEQYINQLKQSDPITRARLLDGNFEYDDDPNALIKVEAIYDLFTNTLEKSNKRYITADIARFGEDKTVVIVWEGLEAIQITYYTKQDLTTTALKIKEIIQDFKIPRSCVIIDEDGIGGGVIDQLSGVQGFLGNSRPLVLKELTNNTRVLANFYNLRSQCYYKLADMVNDYRIYINTSDGTVKNAIVEELQQVKKKQVDSDMKIGIMSKDLVKENLGRSPDFADSLMMRMYFEIQSPTIPDKEKYNDPFAEIFARNNSQHETTYE